MMKYRYVVWMLCVFYLGIGVSLSASSVNIASVNAMDIEKLTPELVQDIFRGAIPGIEEQMMMEILQKGLAREIENINPREIEKIIEGDISGFTPTMVYEIMKGSVPDMEDETIFTIMYKGMKGEIPSVTRRSIEEMLGEGFSDFYIVQNVVMESIMWGIPSLIPESILDIIEKDIREAIPSITPEAMREMTKEGISELPPKILDTIIRDLVEKVDGVQTPKDIMDIVEASMGRKKRVSIYSTSIIKTPEEMARVFEEWLRGRRGSIPISSPADGGVFIPGIGFITPKDIQTAYNEWRQRVPHLPIPGVPGTDGLPYIPDDLPIHLPWNPGSNSPGGGTAGGGNAGGTTQDTCQEIIPGIVELTCTKLSCDQTINCAMSKQRQVLEDRLDDLINTIKANTKQTKHQTKIIEQEVLAYRRLEARVKKEALSLKEARYLSNKIKNSVSIGSTIETSKKGQ